MVATLDAGLVGIPAISIFFFYLGGRVQGSLGPFKLAFNALGFLTMIVFFDYLTNFTTTTAPIQALEWGAVAIFIIYLVLSMFSLLSSVVGSMVQKTGGFR